MSNEIKEMVQDEKSKMIANLLLKIERSETIEESEIEL